MIITLYFAELGDGWAPAVLETEIERDFIRQSQKGLGDAKDYFIGGSAYPEDTGTFDYPSPYGWKLTARPNPNAEPAYSTTQSGNMTFQNKEF